MPRTTINIEQPVLKELKQLQKQSGKPLGVLVSQLLSEALVVRSQLAHPETRFDWAATDMGVTAVDLLDKEALARLIGP